MGKILPQVEKAVKEMDVRLQADDSLKLFVEASVKFEELVKLGIASKRGNTLLSPDERHLETGYFNGKNNLASK